jgi:cation diffusion facilitator CzcD-associated flavoprotein CzcO
MRELPTACVIGAGSSGIAAGKNLHEQGFEFECFEKSDRVGGNWVFKNSNGMSSAYSTLHINTSRERMEYLDFPMPKSCPDYPHHTHIAKYFADYVEHFGFRDRIRFETGVERAQRRPDGVWEISTDRRETRRFDALLVANGHHWDARWPEPAFPGHDTTAIEQIHSHEYTDPEQLRDRDVVVLGMGNSAMDIAVDASYGARGTYLAARRGAHVVPKYIWGRPIDQIGASPRIPFAVRRGLLERMLRVYQGDMQRYGLPAPDHRFGDAHPTISGRILDRLAHGAITPKPNIARLERDHVVFTDGSRVHADLVVYCTGYKVTFPFFAPDLVSAPDNDLPLFRRVFHPAIDNVFFIGLLQPLGAIMPLADVQSHWVCDHLSGRYALPAPAAMRADIEAERKRMFKRYVASKRHTMQVDYDDYLVALEKERRAGAVRASASGHRLPVPPRAAGVEAVPA